MVAYAMRTRLLPLVLAVPILVMLLWGLVLSASFTGFIGAIGALAIFFVVGGIRPSPKIIALMAAVVAVLYMSGYQLPTVFRSEEHTSELQSLMRISYAVFCLKKKNTYPAVYYKIHSKHKHTKDQHMRQSK